MEDFRREVGKDYLVDYNTPFTFRIIQIPTGWNAVIKSTTLSKNIIIFSTLGGTLIKILIFLPYLCQAYFLLNIREAFPPGLAGNKPWYRFRCIKIAYIGSSDSDVRGKICVYKWNRGEGFNFTLFLFPARCESLAWKVFMDHRESGTLGKCSSWEQYLNARFQTGLIVDCRASGSHR